MMYMAGHDVQEEEKAPIYLEGSVIDHVDSFANLGSVVSSNGRTASKAFSALHL